MESRVGEDDFFSFDSNENRIEFENMLDTLRKKNSHKLVEKRRRQEIADGIKELSDLMPCSEKKKGAIIHKAANYIRELKALNKANLEKWEIQKLIYEQAIEHLQNQILILQKAQNEHL